MAFKILSIVIIGLIVVVVFIIKLKKNFGMLDDSMESMEPLDSYSSITPDPPHPIGIDKTYQEETGDENIVAQPRRVEAALPESVHIGDTTELLVMIPRAGDLGLRAHLPIETEAGDLIEADDVTSKDLQFEFPTDPILVYIKVKASSRDFEVEEPVRTIKIHPDREGDYETFFLTALRAVRRARVAVKLYIDKELTDSLATINLSVPIIDADSEAGDKLEEERILYILADSQVTYIAGDSVGGDKINATITNSSGIAIGRESSATVTSEDDA